MIQVKGYYYEEAGQRYVMKPAELSETLRQNGGRLAHDVFPIFDRPSASDIALGKARVAAWHYTPDGERVVRWYWQVREHAKSHSHCCPLGNGLCGFKMVRCANWDEGAGKWVLEPMENRATPEQEQVLDNR